MFILHRYCSGQFDPAVKVEVKQCQKCQNTYFFLCNCETYISPIDPPHTDTNTHRCRCYNSCFCGKTPATFSGHSAEEGQNISNILCMGVLPTLQMLVGGMREIDNPIPPSKTFMSKNGEIHWSSSPNMRQAKLSAENIIKTVPGPLAWQWLVWQTSSQLLSWSCLIQYRKSFWKWL